MGSERWSCCSPWRGGVSANPLVDGDDVEAKPTINARDGDAVLLDELVDRVLAETGVFDQPGKVTKSPKLARFGIEWLHAAAPYLQPIYSSSIQFADLFRSFRLCIYLEVCTVASGEDEYGP